MQPRELSQTQARPLRRISCFPILGNLLAMLMLLQDFQQRWAKDLFDVEICDRWLRTCQQRSQGGEFIHSKCPAGYYAIHAASSAGGSGAPPLLLLLFQWRIDARKANKFVQLALIVRAVYPDRVPA